MRHLVIWPCNNSIRLLRNREVTAGEHPGLALFLFGALVAVVLGTPFDGARLMLGSLIVLTAQLAVNFGNDYFDTKSDQPDGGTLISGGSGVLLQNPELRTPVRWIVAGLGNFAIVVLFTVTAWLRGRRRNFAPTSLARLLSSAGFGLSDLLDRRRAGLSPRRRRGPGRKPGRPQFPYPLNTGEPDKTNNVSIVISSGQIDSCEHPSSASHAWRMTGPARSRVSPERKMPAGFNVR